MTACTSCLNKHLMLVIHFPHYFTLIYYSSPSTWSETCFLCIFVFTWLSVGYSTCHWCHVMERESFEDEEIGKILSDNFVCIKVDREERPDVDKVYMTFVQVCEDVCFMHIFSTQALFDFSLPIYSFGCLCLQATSGGGGWPMSVWLTPDLRPFIGGTYFPPRDQRGRPGLKTVLMRIMEQVKQHVSLNWHVAVHCCNFFCLAVFMVFVMTSLTNTP